MRLAVCRDDSGTRFRIVRWIRSLDSETTTGGFGCTFVAHAASSLSPTWINRGSRVGDRQTLGAGSRRLRTLRYSISVSGSRPAGPRSTAAVNGVARYVGVSPPLSHSLPLFRSSSLLLAPLHVSTLFSVRRSEIRSWRSMNAGVGRSRRSPVRACYTRATIRGDTGETHTIPYIERDI